MRTLLTNPVVCAWALLLLTGTAPAVGAELRLAGIYQGENLYVQNPYLLDEKGYCIRAVHVNGRLLTSGVPRSAYEVDLAFLRVGDTVEVRIEHVDGCRPRVLNPQAIRGRLTLQLGGVQVSPGGVAWHSGGETGATTYYVERKVRGEWTTVTSALLSERPQPAADYQVVLDHASGQNLYRIKAYSATGEAFFSEEAEFMNGAPAVEWSLAALAQGRITLSRPAPYQVVDPYGDAMLKGDAATIEVGRLSPGTYFLHVDDQVVPFVVP